MLATLSAIGLISYFCDRKPTQTDMFSVKVKPEIIWHCQEQIKKYNFGQRSVANGTPDQQLTGIIGQSVIMDLFGLGLIDGSTGFDGGVDIVYEGVSVDVKTMGRTTDVRENYVNNFIALQKDFDTDVYIFCSYNKTKNELTVCGWITKDEFIKRLISSRKAAHEPVRMGLLLRPSRTCTKSPIRI